MYNVKPILVIKLPSTTDAQRHSYIVGNLSNGPIGTDYHIMVFKNNSPEKLEVEVEVLNVRDVQEKDIEELKQLIKQTYEK